MKYLFDEVKVGIRVIRRDRSCTCARILKIVNKLFHISLHLRSHKRIVLTLSQPRIKNLIKTHPHITFKYLDNYLSPSLTTVSRLAILRHHYNVLADAMNESFMTGMIGGGIELWAEQKGRDRYAVALILPDSEYEGELSLIFTCDQTRIFNMSFVIAPGDPLELPSEQVLFITRVQGCFGRFDLIKQATKNMNDISPRALLLAGIEAIATALGIAGIAGICAREQISCHANSSIELFHRSYDFFWQENGGRKINDSVFYLSVPLSNKHVSEIKRNHRSRVKYKRQFKKEFTGQIGRNFVALCLK